MSLTGSYPFEMSLDIEISYPKKSAQMESLPNLGPKSVQMLRSAGIRTLAQLKKHGAVEAYVKVRAIDKRASLNLLWALEGALTGRAWQDVAKKDRLRLLLAVEDYSLSSPKSANAKGARRISRPVRRRGPALT
jgi:DNA transformation protein and related proteins